MMERERDGQHGQILLAIRVIKSPFLSFRI